jgi:Protein of unknown function (DUF3570)
VKRASACRALGAAILVSHVALTVPAHAEDDGEKKADDVAAKPDAAEKKSSSGSNLVGRVSSETSLYSDTDGVTVATPTVAGSLENPLSEWSFGGRYLVDVVSAASADIVATASRRWREVRHAGNLDAAFKIGPIGVGANGSFSSEPDYVAWAAGGSLGLDFAQKNVSLVAGYAFGHDTIGRADTSFDVFSHIVTSHTVNAALTVVMNRDTIMALVGDFIVESGDSSKPYRYIPMFSPKVAPKVDAGASVDDVNRLRLFERPLEQLPTSRDRFAVTARLAHRFTSSTVRISERFYRDTWGLTASSTDAKYIFDIGQRVSLWPHARLHLQTPVAFWQRAYVANYTPGGKWDVPALRTGDRELGPLRGLTGGAGLQIKIGKESAPSDVVLTLQGEAIWTSYLDDLYVTQRVSGLGILALDWVIE